MSATASFEIQRAKDVLNTLDHKIYEARQTGDLTEAEFVKSLRDALAQLHQAVLEFMKRAGYVAVFRQWQRAQAMAIGDALRSLVSPPPLDTEENVKALERALQHVHDVTQLRQPDESVRFTSAQREFMTTFYTLQLRSLEAAWRCVKWTVDTTVAALGSSAHDIVHAQKQCGVWRKAWARQTRTVYEKGDAAQTPTDIVTSWMLMSALTPDLDTLVTEATVLTDTVSARVKSMTDVERVFARDVGAHVEELEQIKTAEVKRLQARAVPPDLEVLSLNNFVAHVRDLLASTPELNLFF
jgi:hypothetical protein